MVSLWQRGLLEYFHKRARARGDSPGFVVDDVKVSLNTNASKPERAEPAGRCFPSHCEE